MTCPNCGTELEKGTPQCPECGTRFMPGKYCPYCHAVMLATASVCPQCGREVDGDRKVSSFRWWRIPLYIFCVILGFAAAILLVRMTSLLDFLVNPDAAPPSGSPASVVSTPESGSDVSTPESSAPESSAPEVSGTAFSGGLPQEDAPARTLHLSRQDIRDQLAFMEYPE